MKVLIIFLLSSLCVPVAYAGVPEDLQKLQQRANAAYEQMMRAQKDADNMQKDASFAERKVQDAKKRLADAQKEADTARQKSTEANIRLERATSQWKEASDILEREWRQSGRK